MPPKDIARAVAGGLGSRFRHVVKTGHGRGHSGARPLRPRRRSAVSTPAASTSTASSRAATRVRWGAPGRRPPRARQVSGLTFAFASCQKWDDGFYSPYRRMAEEDIELVIHLGRLHLRVRSRLRWGAKRQAAGHVRQGVRDARSLSAPALALQDGSGPPGVPQALPVGGHLGRPRGRQRLLGHLSGVRRHEPGVPAAPSRRLPGVLREHAGAAEREAGAERDAALPAASATGTSPTSTCSTRASTERTTPAATASSRPARPASTRTRR